MLWLVPANNRVSASDTVSRLELELRRTSLPCCNFPCNRFVSVQSGLKRESNNKLKKCKSEQMAVADLLPNESHATAHISLLASL